VCRPQTPSTILDLSPSPKKSITTGLWKRTAPKAVQMKTTVDRGCIVLNPLHWPHPAGSNGTDEPEKTGAADQGCSTGCFDCQMHFLRLLWLLHPSTHLREIETNIGKTWALKASFSVHYPSRFKTAIFKVLSLMRQFFNWNTFSQLGTVFSVLEPHDVTATAVGKNGGMQTLVICLSAAVM